MSNPPKRVQTAATTAIADTRSSQPLTITQSLFDTLPDSAFIRESQLVQSPKRPGLPAPLPFSAPTLWRMVKAGRFPAPIKLSDRITAWNVGSVRAWIASHNAKQQTGG
ncbi:MULTISPECIES: AlpA family phage regulatory protein [unclassified Acidovorax]|uniref:helix-turn-helix transcriptional regulator n=1 Tax=unclassified Acidovorax TaxID=2684926 RepID=UPI001C43B598|nr:AlpA family phage regulatory protein [Acidovorax sp. sif0632]MBV7463123.1 AlpA family phage regulatory protein [Acidovorax sp. sif0613]